MERTENVGGTITSEKSESIGNGGKNKFHVKQKTLREWLFAYGMILLPLIQFIIFYVWINANSIIMAFQESTFEWDENGNEIFRWSMYNFSRFFKEWSSRIGDCIGNAKHAEIFYGGRHNGTAHIFRFLFFV